jgi:hypothetical protein
MKAKVIIGIVAILLICSFPALAQMTAYSDIYAEVIAPIGIEKTSDLTFNEIISSNKSETADLGADNFISTTGTILSQNGNGTPASFSIAGGNLTTFDVTLPKEIFAIRGGGTNNMIVSNFTSTLSYNNAFQGSSSIIKVGATLQVPENQTTENFTAQKPFLVTLNYN